MYSEASLPKRLHFTFITLFWMGSKDSLLGDGRPK